MDTGVEKLTNIIAENRTDKAKTPWLVTYTISMSHVNFLSVDFLDESTVYYSHTKLVGDIVKYPDVMIADHPSYLDTGIG